MSDRTARFSGIYIRIAERTQIYTSLPPTNKTQLMDNFDNWVTDPEISLSKVKGFLADKKNIGTLMDGKYKVHTTSGSTGEPALILQDNKTVQIINAIEALRTYSKISVFMKGILKGFRTCGVAHIGFNLSTDNYRSLDKSVPFKVKQIPIQIPIEEMVIELNKFKPAFLNTYPTVMKMLFSQYQEGKLKISPVTIQLAGEKLSESLRKEIEETMHCHVIDFYGTTECGVVTFECKEGNKHINSDWIIIEPVDENGMAGSVWRPVAKIFINIFGKLYSADNSI